MQANSLRILFALAIVYDALGFILFLLGLTPLLIVSIPMSFVVDIVAVLTFLVCITYYLINLYAYIQQKKIEYDQKAKNKPGPIAKKVSELKKKLIQKMTHTLVQARLSRTVYNIIVTIIEAIPYIGDLSPTWSILALFLLRTHRKLNEFLENSDQELSAHMGVVYTPPQVQASRNPASTNPKPKAASNR